MFQILVNTLHYPVHSRAVRTGGSLGLRKSQQILLEEKATNGTFLNDQELPSGGQRPLKSGDVIGIGEYRLSVYRRVYRHNRI